MALIVNIRAKNGSGLGRYIEQKALRAAVAGQAAGIIELAIPSIKRRQAVMQHYVLDERLGSTTGYIIFLRYMTDD